MASTSWRPSTILGLGEISDEFHCIGQTKKKTSCENPIKKDNRKRAKEILISMSTMSPPSHAFDDELAELLDLLLCWRHRKDTQQIDDMTDKWTRAIEEFVRRSGDEVMGEVDDMISSLDAEISDLMERRLRLVEAGRTQIKSEGRGAGFKELKRKPGERVVN